MKAIFESRDLLIGTLLLLSISVAKGAVNDNCHEKCDCEDLTVTCRDGKVPVGTETIGFGTYFHHDVTKMHIDNSRAETSHNDKTRLEPLTKHMLTYEDLTNLTLKGCYIITIEDDAFMDIVALKHLNLDDNEIQTLSSKTFFGLRQLQTLSLNYNKLTSVPSGAFEPLISVVKLLLHGNLISDIQAGAFPKDPLIESLDIGGNADLTKIPPAVDALKNLDKLVARNCKISELRIDWSTKFQGIMVIDLTNNKIAELKKEHFSGLSELKELYLGENRIKRLESMLFPGMAMTTVNISHNEIYFIHDDAVSTASIAELHLSNNPVQSWRTYSKTFKHAEIRWELRKLYLSNVNLEEIGELFDNIKRLEVLDLSHNGLKTVSKRELNAVAPKLQELNLDGNRLTNITGAFDEMTLLEKLTLAGNSLKPFGGELRKVTFPETLMDTLVKLENLDISNNSFTYIPKKLVDAFGRGNNLQIDLHNNPFKCDYNIKPIYDYMNTAPQRAKCPEITKGIDLSTVRRECLKCVKPNRQEKLIILLTDDEMKKPTRDAEDFSTGAIVAILVACIVVLVIIAIVLIMLKRRQEKAKQEPPVGFEGEPDWDNQADYEDSFDESRSTFSAVAKSVAHESNI